MSLKLISVRVPESMHTYIKVKAAAEATSLQQVVTNIIADYQLRDSQYQSQLNQSVTDSLTALASLTQETAAQATEEMSHGV